MSKRRASSRAGPSPCVVAMSSSAPIAPASAKRVLLMYERYAIAPMQRAAAVSTAGARDARTTPTVARIASPAPIDAWFISLFARLPIATSAASGNEEGRKDGGSGMRSFGKVGEEGGGGGWGVVRVEWVGHVPA